jgi:hypothetical protein
LAAALPTDPVAVDPQGERRVGVPELIHRRAGVGAERHQQRGKSVPQLVRGQSIRQEDLSGGFKPFAGSSHRVRRFSQSAVGVTRTA